MRALVLIGLAGLGLASCDSPYGKDFSKNDNQGYELSTGSHIRGGAVSSVSAASGQGVDNALHSSSANRNTLGN